jgi:histidinol dehydrogenase
MKARTLDSRQPTFDAEFAELVAVDTAIDREIERVAGTIVDDVRARGDAALLEYTNRFDRMRATSVAALEIPQREMQAALDALPAEQRVALETAARRIRAFHERQVATTWTYAEEDGTELGQRVNALDSAGLYVLHTAALLIEPEDSAGLYVPGGLAAYPSSLLMNALPAHVAGVRNIVMVVPTPDGTRNPLVLAAAALAGVSRAFAIGGAQAVAALAYGTETVPAVDKIVGPGNAYVAAAKRRVFGVVGIDMIAGPSEILVICDGKTDPDWIAMDLFSQAEHDEMAQSILLSPDAAYLDAVAAAIDKLIDEMPRSEVIRTSLTNRGALIKTRDLDDAAAISNTIAPEHLELSVTDPDALLPKLRHAGAIFMGKNTCEALGDYCAGPNHVLPTSRTARFSSPLGVYDFQKRSSLIHVSQAGAQTLGRIAATLAYGEGLQAHARSAEYRLVHK